MKKNVVRILALVLTAVMLFACASCSQTLLVRFVDKDGNDIQLPAIGVGGGSAVTPAPAADTQPAAPATQPAAPAETQPASDAAPAADSGEGNAAPADAAPADAAPAADSGALPTDNAGILTLYTKLVDEMKAAKPAYRRIEYQALPEEHRNLGTVANAVMGIANGMITTKEKAEADPSIHNQGDDPNNIPIRDNPKGCLLTDASKIKSASCKDNGDGTATLVITLVDEDNPKPVEGGATSSQYYTSAMFFPMDQAGIDNIVDKFKAVVTMNSLVLTYTDCTVTCVFDTATQKIKTLTYVEPVDIKVDGKAVFIPINGSARLVDTMEITEIAY